MKDDKDRTSAECCLETVVQCGNGVGAVLVSLTGARFGSTDNSVSLRSNQLNVFGLQMHNVINGEHALVKLNTKRPPSHKPDRKIRSTGGVLSRPHRWTG